MKCSKIHEPRCKIQAPRFPVLTSNQDNHDSVCLLQVNDKNDHEDNTVAWFVALASITQLQNLTSCQKQNMIFLNLLYAPQTCTNLEESIITLFRLCLITLSYEILPMVGDGGQDNVEIKEEKPSDMEIIASDIYVL